MEVKGVERRFFGSGLAADAVRSCLVEARVVRIATAYFEPGGWALIADLLENKEVRLLIGRESGAADKVEELLREFFADIQSGLLPENVQILIKILSALRQGRLALKMSSGRITGTLDARYLYHHAKLYIADDSRALVTSANFTRSGLQFSREAGYLVTTPADVEYFVSAFDAFFGSAEILTEILIEALEQLLELRSAAEVYARALLEIYGMPDGELPSGLPAPAAYQKPIISRVMRSLSDHRGAFLIASTGLGKTVIAAHVVSLLRNRNEVQAVIVISPAGLRDMWSQSMRAARVSSREFSYTILSFDDWKKYRQAMLLEDELKRDLSNVLLILDESHHMRNDEDSEREVSLRHRRVGQAVANGCRVLLLTATPYSWGVQDINNQLALLPMTIRKGMFFESEGNWQINHPSEISELAPCTVLTAPTVVRHFSQIDATGKRYVTFDNDKRRYFPDKIHLRTILFANALNAILKELITSGLLRRKARSDYDSGLFADAKITGKRDYLYEARLLHQLCSSHAMARMTLQKIAKEGGYEKLRFENQEALTTLAEGLLRKLTKLDEEKATRLFDLIAEHAGEKIVIFCIYQETATTLTEAIAKRFKTIQARCTVATRDEELEMMLDYFAPVANGRISPEEGENDFSERILENRIDILIASEAISEGYNLQDARILINYDLPWSVLQLAQRMGRLMRPWHEPRELIIYNFVADTMFDKELKHGDTWRQRLDQRSLEHQSFASLPVMIPKGDEAVNLYALSEALRDFDATDLNLDEALEFIDRATQVETSTVLDDLARMDSDYAAKVRRLRSGFRSRVVRQKDEVALFLLIARRSSVFAAVFNNDSTLLTAPSEISRPLEILREHKDLPVHTEEFDPVMLDQFAEKCLKSWLTEFAEERQNVSIVCALHFT